MYMRDMVAAIEIGDWDWFDSLLKERPPDNVLRPAHEYSPLPFTGHDDDRRFTLLGRLLDSCSCSLALNNAEKADMYFCAAQRVIEAKADVTWVCEDYMHACYTYTPLDMLVYCDTKRRALLTQYMVRLQEHGASFGTQRMLERQTKSSYGHVLSSRTRADIQRWYLCFIAKRATGLLVGIWRHRPGALLAKLPRDMLLCLVGAIRIIREEGGDWTPDEWH